MNRAGRVAGGCHAPAISDQWVSAGEKIGVRPAYYF